MKVRELNQHLSEAPYGFGSRIANRLASVLPVGGVTRSKLRGQHSTGTEANTLFSRFQDAVARAGGDPRNVSRQYLINWLTTPPNNYPSAYDMIPETPNGRLNLKGVEHGILRTVQADIAGGTAAYHQLRPEPPTEQERDLVNQLYIALQQRQNGTNPRADISTKDKQAIDRAFIRNGQDPMNWEELLPGSKTNPGYVKKTRTRKAAAPAAPAASVPRSGKKKAAVDYNSAEQMINDVLFNKMNPADRNRLVMNLVSKIGAPVSGT